MIGIRIYDWNSNLWYKFEKVNENPKSNQSGVEKPSLHFESLPWKRKLNGGAQDETRVNFAVGAQR